MQQLGRSYKYDNADLSHTHAYLSPYIGAIISGTSWPRLARALDFGCGNGSLTNWLARKGFDTVGVDISESGIAIAQSTYAPIPFSTDTSRENLVRLGPFDLVLCIEVIAHCYDPAAEMEKLWASLRVGGILILSTPYHGYLKNLALAATGRMESHFSTSWPGSCVQFFSTKTISELVHSVGFREIRVSRAGRVPPFAKSMVVCAQKLDAH